MKLLSYFFPPTSPDLLPGEKLAYVVLDRRNQKVLYMSDGDRNCLNVIASSDDPCQLRRIAYRLLEDPSSK